MKCARLLYRTTPKSKQNAKRLACRSRLFSSSAAAPKKTVLYDFHVANGGKMVPFAGWSMPVQYKDLSIIESTIHTRKGASIFDVSHMGQLRWFGKDRVAFLESIVVGGVKPLKKNQAKYSLLPNKNGGLIDDLIYANRSDDKGYHYMVINAARIKEDLTHIDAQMAEAKSKHGWDVDYEFVNEDQLIAFQGPKAVATVAKLVPDYDFTQLKFFFIADLNIAGVDCQVSRTGYTGEDGFEIAVANGKTQELVETLLNEQDVALAGLGARDALRLEAGLCLYGNDLDETTTAVEADLLWTMSKKRRQNGQFLGADVVRDQIANGVKRKRVGIIGQSGKGPSPRQHMAIKTADGTRVGEITSGAFSPCLQQPIAMGYVDAAFAEADTPLNVELRKNKEIAVKVCGLPFVPKGYYK